MINPTTPNDNKVKTSIFYMNDFHGKLPNLERAYLASKAFDTFETSADKLKLSSGDDGLGEDPILNKAVSKLLNMIGITTKENGNHEFDVSSNYHKEINNEANYKELGAVNIHLKPDSILNETLLSSTIEEYNGHKYGIVGIGPSDMDKVLKDGTSSKSEMSVDDVDTTITNLQKEVDKLKAQGLDKIILLSHSGYTNDTRIAKETSGIDIILGGHSHELIEDIKLGKNLFYNKDGEPVVITQAGKDGEHFGILNIEFSNGIITKAQNNVIETKNFNRILPVKSVVEDIIGKPELAGVINSAPPPPKNRLIENNPHGNLFVDVMRTELGTDIALLNSSNIRGYFEKGKVNSRMITEISPFKNKVVVAKINQKELVDAIKLGGTSLKKDGHRPGIVLVSGLKYKLSKQGDLLSLTFIDKNGQEHNIDVNNPDETISYRVSMDDFFATGGDGFSMLNKINVAEKVYDFDKDKLACDYIKRQDKPIDIIDDKRIEIV